MSSFSGFTRKEITKDEYSGLRSADLLVVGSVSDPSGCISPMSTPGTYRMVTIWGKAADEPLIEANTVGMETKYFGYERIVKRNAAFQYCLSDGTCICDKAKITVDEAKQLFNTYYANMAQKAKSGVAFQAGVWINGNSQTDYGEVLIQLHNPEVTDTRNGPVLFETTKTYFLPFK